MHERRPTVRRAADAVPAGGRHALAQAHRRAATLDELARCVAVVVGVLADVTARMLCREERAVLGGSDRLLCKRDPSVQWNPCDSELVAAEVAVGEPAGATWQLAGEVIGGAPADADWLTGATAARPSAVGSA